MALPNPTYKPSESKREEFRRYLEKTGVMDGLTKALVSLYEEPEKPADALQFLQDKLAIQAGTETTQTLKTQIIELQERINQLELEKLQLQNSTAAAISDGGREEHTHSVMEDVHHRHGDPEADFVTTD